MKLQTIIGNSRVHRSKAFRNARTDYLKDLEKWLLRQYQGGHGNICGLAVLLSEGVVDLGQVSQSELYKHPGILAVIRATLRHTHKNYQKMDRRLIEMHKGFQHDLEDMDMRILKKEDVFNHYMGLLAQAEETREIDCRLQKLFRKIAWPNGEENLVKSHKLQPMERK